MHPSRREFIRIAGTGAAGMALGSRAAAQTRVRGANDRVARRHRRLLRSLPRTP